MKEGNKEKCIKIKKTEEIIGVLTDSKVLLQFTTASVIESLRRNPELCNFVLNDISNNNETNRAYYGSNYLSLMLPRQQQQQPFSYISNDPYIILILEESEKLYNELIPELINKVVGAVAAAIKESSLLTANNRQKFTHRNNTYQTE